MDILDIPFHRFLSIKKHYGEEYIFEASERPEYLNHLGTIHACVQLTVAIIFKYGELKMNLYEYWLQVILVFKCFTLSRSFMVDKLERLIKKNRATNVEFLYLWFFGMADEALGTTNGRDLMKFIFNMSSDQKLPIYLETSLKRNSIIYRRFGFEQYNVFETG